VYFMEGISHSVHLFANVQHNNPYFFTQFPWHCDEYSMKVNLDFFTSITGLPVERIIVLANSEIELQVAKKLGLIDSKLVCQNAWLDYNLFKPQFDTNKIYDLVINCRPENWKRPFLAKDVGNLAVIKGANHRPSDYCDLAPLNPVYMNQDRISPQEVCNVLAKSNCGGIFSAIEGACYSSSEYLLMGLPVISTPSLGGRDVWYNDNNSIIVNPNSADVAQAVEEIKDRLNDGSFYPPEIRAMHIAQAEGYRKDFIGMIRARLQGIDKDPAAVFKENYRNKMVRYNKV
jgi:glycosyltransferase involved in cell wall biosynthesis